MGRLRPFRLACVALTSATLGLTARPSGAVSVKYSIAGTLSAISAQTPPNSLAPLTLGMPITVEWTIDVTLPQPAGYVLGYTPKQVVLTVGGYGYALNPVAPMLMEVELYHITGYGDHIYVFAPLTRRTGDPNDPLAYVTYPLSLSLMLSDPSGTTLQGLTPQSGTLTFPNRLASLTSDWPLLDFDLGSLVVAVPEPAVSALLALGAALLAAASRSRPRITRRK